MTGMRVSETLDGFRKALPDCSVVALGDLSTDLVLCTSAAEPVPQETLDWLCGSASAALNRAVTPSGAATTTLETRCAMSHAIVIAGPQTRLFMRSAVDESDVLCCVFGRNVDITNAIELARTTLAGIPDQR